MEALVSLDLHIIFSTPMKRLILLISFLSLIAMSSFAQETGPKCNNNLDDDGDGLVDCRDGDCGAKVCEICDNGIDDDGDRFIDCYDKECSIDAVCKDFFIGHDITCDVKPDSFPPFEMKLKFKSEPSRTNHVNRLIVGDVDDDGTPEIVTTFRNGNSSPAADPTEGFINVLSAPAAGTILQLEKQINTLNDNLRPTFEDIAMADINKDGCAEFFILTATSDGTGYKIMAYDCNGNKTWTSPIDWGVYPGTMGLTDFDGDGYVELYTRTRIYDAHSGTLMAENNWAGSGGSWFETSNAPIAVDILTGSSTQELVAGCRIYSVNINRPAPPPATPPVLGSTLTLSQQRSEYFTRNQRVSGSGTSVADFNLDGYLDIVAVGSTTQAGNNQDRTTTIFFWDVQNNALKTYTDLSNSSDSKYKNGWQNGAGRVNLADIDGDGKMNAVYVSGKYLYALKETAAGLDTLWRRGVTEETSGYTGCTMFDFNADGKSEIVYRDENYIYIYTTTNTSGVVTVTRSTPIRCASRTSNEYPIVVDMNGDGSTEICVVCSTDNVTNGAALTNLYSEAEVRVYESANEPWVPARKLWNQHGYFVANVNDDLTIPKQMQAHHLVYAENAQCFVDGKSRPLNSFLNQSPFLNSFGCPSYAAPNLAVTPFSDDFDVQVNPPTCPDKNFTVSFKFRNKGDIGISGNLPVAFYNGDPMAAGAILLGKTTIPLSNMNPGDTLTQTNVSITGPGSAFTLYIVLNDDGTTIPTPITIPNPNSKIKECDYGDNILKTNVVPLPVTLQAEVLRDNLRCSNVTNAPNNGAVRAYVLINGKKDSTSFNFYWFKGTVAKPIASADHVGHTYTGLPADTYTVYAIHKTAKCNSDTVASVVVKEISRAINVNVITMHNYDDCKNPTGVLQAIVNDTDGDGIGEPTGKFEYTWYAGPDILVGDTLGISHTLTGLKPGSYSVLVTEKTTGCQGNDSGDILDLTVPFTLDTTHVDITCSATAKGSATATVNGGTTGYSFSWFNGSFVKPTDDYTGSVYNNLNAGNYTVFATDINTKCTSDTVTIKVKQTKPPVITGITKDSDQLSCTGSIGAATVNVQGNVSDNTYQWYRGPNTLAANAIAGATNPSITGLAAGTYTVKVTGKTTSCSSTAQITIDGPSTTEILTVVPTGQSTCTPNNGQIEVQTVSPGVPSDYTFEWYTGSAVTASKLISGATTSILSGVNPGIYTVRARHKIYGCVTPAKQTEVLNNIPNIVIDDPVLTEPNDCISNTGRINVIVTTPSVLGYDFRWFKGFTVPASGTPIATVTNTSTTSLVTDLRYGQYVVEITNRDTGCKKEFPIYLPFLNGHTLKPFSQTDITTCVPDNGGSITAELKPTTGFVDTDYTIEYFEGSVDPETPSGTGTPVTSVNPSPTLGNYLFDSNGPFNITTKYYTMVAIANTGALAGCRASATFVIKQTISDPVIDATATAAATMVNKFCKTEVAGNPGSGSITLALGSGVPADYDYQWTSDTDASFSATTKDITSLKPGEYRILMTDNGGVNQGCYTENVFTVLNDPKEVTVNLANGDITLTSLTECGPDGVTPLTQGGAAFQRIMVDGTALTSPFAGYTFDWRKIDNSVVADNDAVPGDIGNLGAGEFYVTANETSSNCDVTASFTIEDETINSVNVDLLRFVVPSKCLKPTNVLGELEVQASGLPGTNYAYSWFTGATTTTPLPAGNVTGTDSYGNAGNIAQTINPGFFTVSVENTTSHCKVVETYELSQDTAIVTMTASTSPLTFCVNPDGSMYATVTSGSPNDYDYKWYIGAAVKPSADYTGKLVENIQPAIFPNTFLVVATDQADAFCEVSASVSIDDMRVYPVVTATAVNPRTNCDVVKADGIVSASVDGNVIDYTFDWYGETITPPPFATGSQISDLRDSTYTVIASDLVSGCSDTTQVILEFVPVGVEQPSIEVISHVTSCVDNNGILSASVNGNTSDYIFEWYIGNAVKASPDFVGSYYDSLAVGIYTVRATSLITGCVSDPVSEEILSKPVLPEFEFAIIPASCDEENGQIMLTITNDVDIDEIIWESVNGTIMGDPVLDGIPAGLYKVTVRTQLGCEASKEVEVKTDIHPYNGISRNGDGKNDIFFINCIQNFPDNIVKVFNRAGTLVYEHEGYNNIDIFFDGKSNKGISVMGTNLPDGTYFYIIDKRDGSKPLAGYLEIVN
jgi:hypothetical protein